MTIVYKFTLCVGVCNSSSNHSGRRLLDVTEITSVVIRIRDYIEQTCKVSSPKIDIIRVDCDPPALPVVCHSL